MAVMYRVLRNKTPLTTEQLDYVVQTIAAYLDTAGQAVGTASSENRPA